MSPADEGASEPREGEVEVAAPLVADSEATEASQSPQGSLHDPAVASRMFAALDAAVRDPRSDAARSALISTTAMIVAERVCIPELLQHHAMKGGPAACHAPSRLQLALPLQPTSERGGCFHYMPVRRTKMMPASATRTEARGRPPFDFSGSDGRSGAINAQTSSGTRTSMPGQPANRGFVPRS